MANSSCLQVVSLGQAQSSKRGAHPAAVAPFVLCWVSPVPACPSQLFPKAAWTARPELLHLHFVCGSKQPLTLYCSGLDFPSCWHWMLVVTAGWNSGSQFAVFWRLSSLVGLLCVEFSEEQHFGCSGPLSSPKAWPLAPAPQCCILGKCQCHRGGLVGGLMPRAEQTLLVPVMC